MKYNILTQAVGVLAMIFSVASFQLKTKKQIIVMQCITSITFAVHYFMLPDGSGIAGGVVNSVALVRNVIFYFKDKKFFRSSFWLVFFAVIMGASAVVSRFEAISAFMCVAMIFNTFAVWVTKPVDTRKMILIASPFAFVYNVAIGSVGGIANEVLVETITAVTFVREKRKNREKK